MSIITDIKYAKLLNLEQFKEAQKNHFNFRCPFCGDSQKSKTKKRGWLIPTPDHQGLFFNCFNCHEPVGGMFFFIQKLNKPLLKEYNREKFEEKNGFKQIQKVEELPQIISKNDTVKNIQTIDSLPAGHIARIYVERRRIDSKYYHDLYYTDNYKKWIVENYLPEKYQNTGYIDERIVFPLYTQQGELIGLQGRSLDPNNEVRYLTVKIKDTNHILCYNFNRINIVDFIYTYVVEGPFDALVLNNAIAMLRSNINLNFIKEHLSPKNTVFIFDNEPRNKFIVNNYDKISDMEDFGLFLWPKNIGVKDLNDLAVKNNWNQNQMTEFVNKYIVFGRLKKKIQLTNWKIN
jgi:hypothetical protein